MRYFIELQYKGTNYAGFQVQQNAITIQYEVERVLLIFFKVPIKLSGASRTDAGVHAHQNYFQFDFNAPMPDKILYNLNALLPFDIAIKSICLVSPNAHARFNAISREYHYYIYTHKDPFLFQIAWFYPYAINFSYLQTAAQTLLQYTDFTSFSKRNSQVSTHNCTLLKSEWIFENNCLVYHVKANRFLRGMVRGLVGTMLQVGRGAISIEQFRQIIEDKDCTKANFSTPAHGLFLQTISYPHDMFQV